MSWREKQVSLDRALEMPSRRWSYEFHAAQLEPRPLTVQQTNLVTSLARTGTRWDGSTSSAANCRLRKVRAQLVDAEAARRGRRSLGQIYEKTRSQTGRHLTYALALASVRPDPDTRGPFGASAGSAQKVQPLVEKVTPQLVGVAR